jgi:hypothetical protein
MRFLNYIILLFICISYVSAQENQATFVIKNSRAIAPDSLEFEIWMERNSDRWERFANASFNLDFIFSEETVTAGLAEIDPEELGIKFLPNNETDFKNITPGDHSTTDVSSLGLNEYKIIDRIYIDSAHGGRINITFVGSDEYPDTKYILTNDNMDSSLFIAKFLLYSKTRNKQVARKVGFKEPIDYYQNVTYKINDFQDRFTEFDEYYEADDNISMIDSAGGTSIAFFPDDAPPPDFVLRYINPQYIGNGKMRISWATVAEIFNTGFMIERVRMPYFSSVEDLASINWVSQMDKDLDFGDELPAPNPDILIIGFGDTVLQDEAKGNYSNEILDAKLLAGGDYKDGNDYDYIDTADFVREDFYCFQVSSIDWNGTVTPLGQTCEKIPNAIITLAEAKPNPFVMKTTVQYAIDDDVTLWAYVVDGQGRIVQTIYENTHVQKGSYLLDISLPEFASQGLYSLVFTAEPINDKSFEVSRALVKLHMIK